MKAFYKFMYIVLWPFSTLFFGYRGHGRENVPKGAAIICAPHSNLTDPILAALPMGINDRVYFMAKKELAKGKLITAFLKLCGAVFVERGTADVAAIKTTMKLLKEGNKVLIFPEGTRLSQADSQATKAGAVRIAAKTGVPIVPVYVPRNKKLFRRTDVYVGKVFVVEKPSKDAPDDYYERKADELMKCIEALGESK